MVRLIRKLLKAIDMALFNYSIVTDVYALDKDTSYVVFVPSGGYNPKETERLYGFLSGIAGKDNVMVIATDRPVKILDLR